MIFKLQSLLLVLTVIALQVGAKPTVDFSKIESPAVFRGDFKFAYRDPAAVYHNGRFHLYFTLGESAPDGGYYLRIAHSSSSDLVHWTYPEPLTPRDRDLNYSSPGNVVRLADEMFHSPGNGIGMMRSTDLVEWRVTGLLTLGQKQWPWAQGRLTAATVIDLRCSSDVGQYVMFFHGDSVEGRKSLRAHCAASPGLAWSDDLKTWDWPGKADQR